MGYPNIDFFVREARECVSGDMVIVRYVLVRFPLAMLIDRGRV
jgi:hypothetical protein